MLWYLAAPYTDADNKGERAKTITHIAAMLWDAGLVCYSPITHGHELAYFLGNKDHDWWLLRDLEFMKRCEGLLVLKLPGWQTSVGVQFEISYFLENGKPILCLNPEDYGI